MADQGVQFTEDAASRIVRAVQKVERLPVHMRGRAKRRLGLPETGAFFGILTEEGPAGEPDWADQRYWARRAYASNTTGTETDALEFTAYETPDPLARTVMVTNVAEIIDQSHSLQVGTVDGSVVGQAVYVRKTTDRSSPGVVKFWIDSAIGIVPFVAVVTQCARIDTVGNLQISARKLTGLPYSFNAGEEIVAWAGVDPMVVIDSMVLVFPIAPLPDNPEITHFALPHMSVEPSTLDEPDANCITTFGSTCDPAVPADPCNRP